MNTTHSRIDFTFAGVPATFCPATREILIDSEVIPLSAASSLLREAALEAEFTSKYSIE
jgi:hypothetical protein